MLSALETQEHPMDPHHVTVTRIGSNITLVVDFNMKNSDSDSVRMSVFICFLPNASRVAVRGFPVCVKITSLTEYNIQRGARRIHPAGLSWGGESSGGRRDGEEEARTSKAAGQALRQ